MRYDALKPSLSYDYISLLSIILVITMELFKMSEAFRIYKFLYTEQNNEI